MTVKTYFPISVAVLLLTAVMTHHYSVPLAPFALILLAGETLLGFQLEDHKVAKVIKRLFSVGR